MSGPRARCAVFSPAPFPINVDLNFKLICVSDHEKPRRNVFPRGYLQRPERYTAIQETLKADFNSTVVTTWLIGPGTVRKSTDYELSPRDVADACDEADIAVHLVLEGKIQQEGIVRFAIAGIWLARRVAEIARVAGGAEHFAGVGAIQVKTKAFVFNA